MRRPVIQAVAHAEFQDIEGRICAGEVFCPGWSHERQGRTLVPVERLSWTLPEVRLAQLENRELCHRTGDLTYPEGELPGEKLDRLRKETEGGIRVGGGPGGNGADPDDDAGGSGPL